MSVDRAALRRGLEFLRRGDRRPPTAADVLALAAGRPGRRPAPAADRQSTRAGWLGDLLAGTRGPHADPGRRRPPAFTAQLRPYQQRGRRLAGVPLLARPGRLPGRRHGPGQDRPAARPRGRTTRGRDAAGPTLLICPMSMVGTWEREAAPLRPGPAGARPPRPRPPARRRPARGLADDRPRVTTYATAARDADDLADVDWHRLVLDEAQAVKNAAPPPARAVRRFRAGTASRSPAPRGEPPRRALVDHGRAQPRHPRHRRAVPRPATRSRSSGTANTDAAELLRRTTRPYLLRRVKTDPHDHRRPAREDRDHPALPAHPRAGLALPHGRRRHAGEDRGLRRHRAAAATCWPR